MTYALVHHDVEWSTMKYPGIKCSGCQRTGYRHDDIENKYCRFCNITLKKPRSKAVKTVAYTLYSGSKKSLKYHWSTNGTTALCKAGVTIAVRKPSRIVPDEICVNCADLKRRGFNR